ncbi:MAG: hypothetical protein Q4F57_02535 [Weeksellaceae bacterium]|nr:hypothetical protein [Weeksellaceae bacterium]
MKKLDKDIYHVGGSAALVFTKSPRFAKAEVAMEKNADDGEFSLWGDDNLYPQRFLAKFNRTDAAVGGIEVLTTAHYGNGFKLFKEKNKGDSIVQEQQLLSDFPEIKSFFSKVKFPKMLTGIIADFEVFRLAFPEYLLSPNGDKIISVKRHRTAWCRFGVPDKSGYVRKVFINSDWETANADITVSVDLIPDEFASADEIKEYAKSRKLKSFILPVTSNLMTEKLYPAVGWHSSFNNGWVDTVLSVPEFKLSMFINQLNMKYLVYVSDEFMVRRYGAEDWESISAAEREMKREELARKIDDHMSGNKAAGRSLTSPYFRDNNGQMIKGIEVVPVDDKIKDGNFLPDAAAGNSQILFAMAVDPSLIGAGIPGGKNLSGSGSDKREAYTILCSKMPYKRICTTEIFNIIRDYNGWDADLIGNFPNQNLTTLDKNPAGVKEIIL